MGNLNKEDIQKIYGVIPEEIGNKFLSYGFIDPETMPEGRNESKDFLYIATKDGNNIDPKAGIFHHNYLGSNLDEDNGEIRYYYFRPLISK